MRSGCGRLVAAVYGELFPMCSQRVQSLVIQPGTLGHGWARRTLPIQQQSPHIPLTFGPLIPPRPDGWTGEPRPPGSFKGDEPPKNQDSERDYSQRRKPSSGGAGAGAGAAPAQDVSVQNSFFKDS
ncbi:hypothetical protein GCM10027174_36430 [Salinifilum aidingensis]